MKEVFLCHHLGLGDHIITNGLVRELLNRYDIINYPVKIHNVSNVSRMFGDVEQRVKILPVSGDVDMINASRHHKNVMKFGIFSDSGAPQEGEYFCQWFYRSAAVDYKKRWSSFYIPDRPAASPSFKGTQAFSFVHDDVSRDLEIRQSLIGSYDIFRPDHHLGKSANYTIFDYKPVILASTEIHCMDSSFSCYIDHISEVRHKKKFIHRYIREENMNPLYKNNWKVIYE